MRKMMLFFTAILFISSTVFADNFVPTVLTISAPAIVHYDFDGSALQIPVTIKGTPATTILCVFTKDQAATIPTIQNGYLGWHTVNKVDTSIYIAPTVLLDIGSNLVTWDGRDQDGNAVPEGDYTYYLWSFDNVNAKYSGCSILNYNVWGGNFIDYDPIKGEPLAEPIYYTHPYTSKDLEGMMIRGKWILGSDPIGDTLLETTYYSSASELTKLIPSPYEADKFWIENANDETMFLRIYYYQWVPGGEAVLQNDWGNEGYFSYESPGADGWDLVLNAVNYVGNDLLIGTRGSHYGNSLEAEIILINATEGSEITRLDVSDWWVRLEDGEAGAQKSGGPNRSDVAKGGFLVLGSHAFCMNICVNPTRGEDVEDFLVWANDNGDYVGDHNFEEDAERPWVCHDYNVGPYKYNVAFDGNMFSTFPSFDMGAVSFGLYAPDGSGISYLAYSGETAGGKNYSFFIQYSSPFDGMYSDFMSLDGEWGGTGIWFVGHDSFKGVITNEVAVAGEAPAAFTVGQNSPNPFNPATTISFTVADAGNVSIDVFNVAGQRVDTVVNEFKSAGSHSVTWNASDFSAGVYFYTVKSGDYTKTMKMTLLK